MKKIIIIFFILILSSCNLPLSDEEYISIYTQDIANAIVNKDDMIFKELFSPNVINYYNDFDIQMNTLFEYTEGSFESVRKHSASTSKSTHYGYVEKYFNHTIEITTSLYTYKLYVTVCAQDDIDVDNIGFHFIGIQRLDYLDDDSIEGQWIKVGYNTNYSIN